jgi:excisionase family DNA binding protein
MKEKKTPQWFTIREAADYLRVGEPTIYRWMRDSRITFRKVGDSTRFLQEDLDELVTVHPRKEAAERVREICSLCGHEEVMPGRVQSTGLIYFRPDKTKFWKLTDSNVKTQARMCTNCGHVLLFGDTSKLEGLKTPEED